MAVLRVINFKPLSGKAIDEHVDLAAYKSDTLRTNQ
jgi:hypothetical protein